MCAGEGALLRLSSFHPPFTRHEPCLHRGDARSAELPVRMVSLMKQTQTDFRVLHHLNGKLARGPWVKARYIGTCRINIAQCVARSFCQFSCVVWQKLPGVSCLRSVMLLRINHVKRKRAASERKMSARESQHSLPWSSLSNWPVTRPDVRLRCPRRGLQLRPREGSRTWRDQFAIAHPTRVGSRAICLPHFGTDVCTTAWRTVFQTRFSPVATTTALHSPFEWGCASTIAWDYFASRRLTGSHFRPTL